MTRSPSHDFDILVAEDNPEDLYLIQEALKTHHVPCRIHAVETSDEFLAYAQETCHDEGTSKPDLIILDWSLPPSGGSNLVRSIRETARCADAYILVLTSSLSPKDREDALRAGVNRFLSKPVELDDFLSIGAIVKDALSRRN